MTYTTPTVQLNVAQVISIGILAALAVFFGFASLTHAASYAYVDTTGDVKSVSANDWMTAISIAPGIHMHSGVMLLKDARDYTIVGDNVSAF